MVCSLNKKKELIRCAIARIRGDDMIVIEGSECLVDFSTLECMIEDYYFLNCGIYLAVPN
jgi:hypothetical protein